MTDVKDFLMDSVDTKPATLEFKIGRFKAPFVLQSLSAEKGSALQKEATHPIRNPRTGVISNDLNSQEYADLLLSESVISPDLKNAELQKSWGAVADPIGLLKKMLRAGEYTELLSKTQSLSGFDLEDTEALVDQAKK